MGQKGQIERHLREMAAIHKTMMSFVISCLELTREGVLGRRMTVRKLSDRSQRGGLGP